MEGGREGGRPVGRGVAGEVDIPRALFMQPYGQRRNPPCTAPVCRGEDLLRIPGGPLNPPLCPPAKVAPLKSRGEGLSCGDRVRERHLQLPPASPTTMYP